MTGDQAERSKKRVVREWDIMDDREETVRESSNGNAKSHQGKSINPCHSNICHLFIFPSDELRAILAHQIEFEIALRKRVAKVVEARMRWAEELKEALVQGTCEISLPLV